MDSILYKCPGFSFHVGTHSCMLPCLDLQFLFKKYLEYEKSYGDEKQIESVKQKAMEYVQNTLAWWYRLLFPASVSISTQHALGSVHGSRCIPKMLPNAWSGFAAILMGGKGTGYMQLIGSNSGQWCRWGNANTIYHSAIFLLHNRVADGSADGHWCPDWLLMKGVSLYWLKLFRQQHYTCAGSSPFCTGFFYLLRGVASSTVKQMGKKLSYYDKVQSKANFPKQK